MNRVLLGLAAATAAMILVTPAQAQGFAAADLSAFSGTQRINMLQGVPAARAPIGRLRHIRVGDAIAAGAFGYDDPGDYDANRSFDPDRWNDWWHDRPDRAFPRWMTRNQGCERRWYSGDVLTC